MSGYLGNHHSPAEQFVGDFVRTFARLLDPNLPPATRVATSDSEESRWPLGQTVALATVGSLSLWGLLAVIVYNFA